MENDKKIAEYCIEAMQKKGADKSQVVLNRVKKEEMNIETGKFSLMRTTFDINCHLKMIRDNRLGMLSVNKLEKNNLDQAIETIFTIAASSPQDTAYDMAGKQPPEKFSAGYAEPEKDTMFERLASFCETAKAQFPDTILEGVILDFKKDNAVILNSEGVDFSVGKGVYGFSTMFTTRKGNKSSSFNYSSFMRERLDNELVDCGSVATLLRQSSGQLELGNIPGKFEGDIIITPDCLQVVIEFFTRQLSDYYLVSGTSVFKERLGKAVASPCFTLHSRPLSNELSYHYFVTSDGFKVKDATIVDEGVLSSFLLSLYGSNKTGLPMAANNGRCYVVEPGNTPLDKMISEVKKGLLLCRVSGGEPNDNGDFSAVAKNSYFIRDGEIQYPVSETMITGNISDMLRSIGNISRERINFGDALFPWVQTGGITIFGKE